MESSAVWNKMIPYLEQHFTLLMPDLPGHGQSVSHRGPFDMQSVANAVEELCSSLGIHHFHLAGHSMGAYVALELLEILPDAVLSLSFLQSTSNGDSERRKKMREATSHLLDRKKELLITTAIASQFPVQMDPSLLRAKEDLIREALPLPTSVLQAYQAGMADRKDFEEELLHCAIPLLFSIGKDDTTIAPKEQLRQAASLEMAKHQLLPCGHMGILEQPKAIADFLIRHLIT